MIQGKEILGMARKEMKDWTLVKKLGNGPQTFLSPTEVNPAGYIGFDPNPPEMELIGKFPENSPKIGNGLERSTEVKGNQWDEICVSTVEPTVSICRVQKIHEGSRGLQCNKWEMGQGKIIWLESDIYTV